MGLSSLTESWCRLAKRILAAEMFLELRKVHLASREIRAAQEFPRTGSSDRTWPPESQLPRGQRAATAHSGNKVCTSGTGQTRPRSSSAHRDFEEADVQCQRLPEQPEGQEQCTSCDLPSHFHTFASAVPSRLFTSPHPNSIDQNSHSSMSSSRWLNPDKYGS